MCGPGSCHDMRLMCGLNMLLTSACLTAMSAVLVFVSGHKTLDDDDVVVVVVVVVVRNLVTVYLGLFTHWHRRIKHYTARKLKAKYKLLLTVNLFLN